MNPLKRELILYLILLAAFSTLFYLCHFCPHSTPSFHPALFTLSPSCPLLFFFFYLFSEGSVSKSSSRAAEGEAGKDEASRNDRECVRVCKCWLSEEGECEES